MTLTEYEYDEIRKLKAWLPYRQWFAVKPLDGGAALFCDGLRKAKALAAKCGPALVYKVAQEDRTMTLAKRLQAISKFPHYTDHDKMVSALTEFNREQTKRAHMWNIHFLPIALRSLDEYEREGGPLSDYFNDRALVALQIVLGQATSFKRTHN